eukprot:Nk52_evm64s2657 gene=Nk52_evmTU64s2657
MAMKDGRNPDGRVSQVLRDAIADVKKTASQIRDTLDKMIAVLVIVLSHPVIRADMHVRETVQSLTSNVNRSRNDSLLHIGRVLPGSAGYIPVTFEFDSEVNISTQRMANSDGTYVFDFNGQEVLVPQTKFEVKLDEMTDIIWALYENITNSKKCSPANMLQKLRADEGFVDAEEQVRDEREAAACDEENNEARAHLRNQRRNQRRRRCLERATLCENEFVSRYKTIIRYSGSNFNTEE